MTTQVSFLTPFHSLCHFPEAALINHLFLLAIIPLSLFAVEIHLIETLSVSHDESESLYSLILLPTFPPHVLNIAVLRFLVPFLVDF